MIAVCTPSRGLIYTRTVESIINGMKHLNSLGLPTNFYSTFDMPIPQSHTTVVEKALQDNAQKIILVEEDMFIFPEGYEALVSSEADISTMQYNDKNGSPHGIIHYNESGEVLWAGLGATCIKSSVFEKIGKPYFRTNVRYENIKKHIKDDKAITEYREIEPRKIWNEETLQFEVQEDHYKYGGQDIDFYTRARKTGCKIEVLKEHKAHHFDLVKLGEPHTNNGCHIIKQV